MNNGRWLTRALFTLTVILFFASLPIVGCSGCNLRRRGDKRACRNGNVDKCLALGAYYEGKTDGLLGFLMSNGATASDYYFRACKLKSGAGCVKMRSLHYDSAKDPSFSITEEADALIATCAEERPTSSRSDQLACDQLWDFMDGVDWAQNRAAHKLDDLCAAGTASACYWVGRMHGQELGGLHNTWDEVIPLYEKACTNGVDPACIAAQEYRKVKAEREAAGDAGVPDVTSDAGESP
jgi:TPR repeat protein